MSEYYKRSAADTLKALKSSDKGLSDKEAKVRLASLGQNILHEKKMDPLWKLFLMQFRSFIVGILIAAVIISFVIGERLDAVVIGIILVLNAVMGFVQEFKAEKSIEALKKLTSLQAIVIRNNEKKKIDAKELVPGDIIVLETGEKVPADARLIESINIQAQEATLTGESTPVNKNLDIINAEKGIADRKNMLFSGTILTMGRGLAIVTETGMNTEIGKIATMIQTTKAELTPLQKKLRKLGEYLGFVTILVCVIVFFAGILSGKEPLEMFIAAISLAVAAIPEGLPAVVTISLALGIQRMIKRNALIRKLPSVETLGSTTVICTDKTGTLTHNEMTVKKIYVNGKIIDVTGGGYNVNGIFSYEKKIVNPNEFSTLLQIGSLCNDAKLAGDSIIGDPTEGALIVSAAKARIVKKELDTKCPRLDEIQFDSERKMMSTLHKVKGKKKVYTKGAPDVILKYCDRILVDGTVRRLKRDNVKDILKINETFAKQSLRVLGFAYKKSDKIEEKGLIFVGLQAMIDPPRDEARISIEKCKKAGINVIMITGDYKSTAEAIGKELGLEGKAIDGQQLDKIKDLGKVVGDISIFARVNPEHKIRIVEVLKKKGHIVAMTGDGVNDAPALKKADIGIAMGVSGTDVAKEASEMILTDDNFSSIVNAVEEGRGIYDNIKKFVEYLLSSNLGEILTIFIAILAAAFFENALPLIAIQILWINLTTDGLPALALGVNPKEPDLMTRQPRKHNENILSKFIIPRMIYIGIIMMVGTLGMFKYYLSEGVLYAQTVAFCTLMMFQMFNVLNCRSEHNSLFRIGLFSNRYLIVAIFISILMQLLVVYTPLNLLFKTVALPAIEWVYIVLVSSTVLIFNEVVKLIRNSRVKQVKSS